ncbi:hypothetical protein C8F01DRAFT_1044184 [Mycena amicta]|nr:hypothetical protein C8F01DRAFT_1044184 [Mycena amicta]
MLTRQKILELLRDMGVELPRKTKLPDSELDKRLSKALDSAQYVPRVVPDPPLDPAMYPDWFEDSANDKLLDAVRRHNFGEAATIAASRTNGIEDPFPLYGNAFMDLRQTLMSIGNVCDKREGAEFPCVAVQDKEGLSAIIMRILDVRKFDNATPIFVVLFRRDLRTAVSKTTLEWLKDNMKAAKLANITATLEEQELLLRILTQNSKRLTKNYAHKRRQTESSFTLTFLLPVGPLIAKDLAKHSTNTGCTVCGEPAKSKCSRCGVVRYCDPVCQKDDWKSHRALCNKWQSSQWQQLTFVLGHERVPGAYAVRLGKFDIYQHRDLEDRVHRMNDPTKMATGNSTAPANTHGASPFIIKVQLSAGPTPPSGVKTGRMWDFVRPEETALLPGQDMLIYDQKRALDVMVWRADRGAGPAFDAVANIVKSKGEQGLKMFFWAVRTGDWTMDVCLEYFPEWQNW